MANLHDKYNSGKSSLHFAMQHSHKQITKQHQPKDSLILQANKGNKASPLAVGLGKSMKNKGDPKIKNLCYRRKSCVQVRDHKYNINLLLLLLFKLSRSIRFENWYIGINLEDIDNFGDIVFRHCYNGKQKIWFIKAINKVQRKSSNIDEKVSENIDIHSLFKSYVQIRNQLKCPNNKQFLPEISGDVESRFIVHTSDSFNFGVNFMRHIEPFDIEPVHLLQTSKQGKGFKIRNDKELVQSLIQNYSTQSPNLRDLAVDFLNKLYIFYSQATPDKFLDIFAHECNNIAVSDDHLYNFITDVQKYYCLTGEVEYLTIHSDMKKMEDKTGKFQKLVLYDTINHFKDIYTFVSNQLESNSRHEMCKDKSYLSDHKNQYFWRSKYDSNLRTNPEWAEDSNWETLEETFMIFSHSFTNNQKGTDLTYQPNSHVTFGRKYQSVETQTTNEQCTMG